MYAAHSNVGCQHLYIKGRVGKMVIDGFHYFTHQDLIIGLHFYLCYFFFYLLFTYQFAAQSFPIGYQITDSSS